MAVYITREREHKRRYNRQTRNTPENIHISPSCLQTFSLRYRHDKRKTVFEQHQPTLHTLSNADTREKGKRASMILIMTRENRSFYVCRTNVQGGESIQTWSVMTKGRGPTQSNKKEKEKSEAKTNEHGSERRPPRSLLGKRANKLPSLKAMT